MRPKSRFPVSASAGICAQPLDHSALNSQGNAKAQQLALAFLFMFPEVSGRACGPLVPICTQLLQLFFSVTCLVSDVKASMTGNLHLRRHRVEDTVGERAGITQQYWVCIWRWRCWDSKCGWTGEPCWVREWTPPGLHGTLFPTLYHKQSTKTCLPFLLRLI